MIQSCKSKIDHGILKDAFLFTYEYMKKYQGSWHLMKDKMFPGYVFLESDDGSRLSEELEPYRSTVSVRILEDDKLLLSIQEEEQKILEELCGRERHMSMSRGIIQQGITHVTEGPLKGKEQLIRRIDRHKRVAYLNHCTLPGKGFVKAGLEIESKEM